MNKPIMHVILDPKAHHHISLPILHNYTHAMKKHFIDKYDIVFSIKDSIQIIPDNTTIVNVDTTNFTPEELLKYLTELSQII